MSNGEAARAGQELFWLRITAAAIDLVAAVALAQLAAVALYAASDGRLRSSTLAKVAHCRAMSSVSAKLVQGVAAPPGAQPVAANMCTVSTLGLETARYVTVGLQAQDGEVVRTMAFSRPVDRQGEPVTPVILDWAYPLAFILAMSAAEWLAGATLGKRLVGLRVRAEGGGRLPAHRALGRNLAIWGGLALVLVAPLAAAVWGIRLGPTGYYTAVGALALLVLAPVAMLTLAAPRALYDRWTGAEVEKA